MGLPQSLRPLFLRSTEISSAGSLKVESIAARVLRLSAPPHHLTLVRQSISVVLSNFKYGHLVANLGYSDFGILRQQKVASLINSDLGQIGWLHFEIYRSC